MLEFQALVLLAGFHEFIYTQHQIEVNIVELSLQSLQSAATGNTKLDYSL